jgi:hypothetical protein
VKMVNLPALARASASIDVNLLFTGLGPCEVPAVEGEDPIDS